MRPWLTLIGAVLLGCSPALNEVGDFGSNPGGLRMFERAPAEPDRGLLLVLHGCSQGHGFAKDAGFLALAEAHDFALLAPEQALTNNGQGCFNWFNEDDASRDSGELLSLRQMVDDASARHAVDADRVFLVGVSAGAALGASALAGYPERFAGGALLGGGPHGCARSVLDAAGCMAALVEREPDEWADEVRAASDHDGPWPFVSIWNGADDLVVNPSGSAALVAQWTGVHEVARDPTAESTLRSTVGAAVVENFDDAVLRVQISGLGHAFPVAPDEGCGVSAPFLQDIGLCAAARIIRDFGLDE